MTSQLRYPDLSHYTLPPFFLQARPPGTHLLMADQGFVAAVVREGKLILHYFVHELGPEAPAMSVARCVKSEGPCLAS